MRWNFRLAAPIAAVALAAVLTGATRLYLKDGSYHAVREYKVENGKVRFYSTERSEWEEIPSGLVDWKKTESEQKSHDVSSNERLRIIDAEEKAERLARQEAERIPVEPGVYFVQGTQIRTLKAAEAKLVDNKRRRILGGLSPIPVVAGKATLEVDGPRAAFAVETSEPEFYIRLSQEERFGIARLSAHKENRVVEKVTIVPVTKEMLEEPEMVEVFRRQIDDMLYKIWPMRPLEPGEYAVLEYTEGKVNAQIWDFEVAAAKAPFR